MDDMKFGIEAEYALIRPDGRFADYTNTDFAEVRRLIEPLPDYGHAELRVGDAGIRVKNWYVEGDERFDRDGRSSGIAFKGIEIRTPTAPTIDGCIASLQALRAMLRDALAAERWSLTAIGFNPCTASYRPDYRDWERAFHASHAANALPEVSTLSYGPDLNFSRRGDTPARVLEKVGRLTHYSPYIVPFSFSSPFAGGALLDALSHRTARRTGPRPAALAHLMGRRDHPMAREADPPSQHLRIEFKAFDMVGDDRLLAELFRLVLGISLDESGDLPGTAATPDRALHRAVAGSGFGADAVHREAARIVAAAREALRTHGEEADFPLLKEMLRSRRTPAHAMRERYRRTGSFWEVL